MGRFGSKSEKFEKELKDPVVALHKVYKDQRSLSTNSNYYSLFSKINNFINLLHFTTLGYSYLYIKYYLTYCLLNY